MISPQVLVAMAAVGGLITVGATAIKVRQLFRAPGEVGGAAEDCESPIRGLSGKDLETIRQFMAMAPSGPVHEESKIPRRRPLAYYGARRRSYLGAFPKRRKLQKFS